MVLWVGATLSFLGAGALCAHRAWRTSQRLMYGRHHSDAHLRRIVTSRESSLPGSAWSHER